MTADHETWRDVLSNLETFLEHAEWDEKGSWWLRYKGRTVGTKVSLAYRWKEEAVGEFESVNLFTGGRDEQG